MTVRDKLCRKIMEYPPRKDITFDELIKVLEMHDFECTRISSSHYIFKNRQQPSIELDAIPRPHGGNNCVKRSYIEKVQEAIKEYLEVGE